MSNKELEMKQEKVPFFDTIGELIDYIEQLTNIEHDYGTSVCAMSMAATATFNYMARQLGCSGFQASCADLDFLRRTRRLENGFQIIDYSDLLYPQCKDRMSFSFYELIEKNLESLAKTAQEKLKEGGSVHEDVKKHWQFIVNRNAMKRGKQNEDS